MWATVLANLKHMIYWLNTGNLFSESCSQTKFLSNWPEQMVNSFTSHLTCLCIIGLIYSMSIYIYLVIAYGIPFSVKDATCTTQYHIYFPTIITFAPFTWPTPAINCHKFICWSDTPLTPFGLFANGLNGYLHCMMATSYDIIR